MSILIVILLAVSGPLYIGRCYQNNRVWASFAGAFWFLLALFFAGLNFATARNLAVTHPLYSLAVLVAVSVAFYFTGPQSRFWELAGRLRVVRILALRVRRIAHRRGISRRLAGEAVAMVVVFVILAPVSFLTLKPDPAYEYAIGKFQRELDRQLPDTGKLADAAMAEALGQMKDWRAVVDAEAFNAARSSIADSAKRVQGLVKELKAPQERLDAARKAVEQIGSAAGAKLLSEMERASRRAMADTAKRILDAERPGLLNKAREAIDAAVPGVITRAKRTIDGTPVDDLPTATSRLIDEAQTEITKAGRDAATAEAQRLLENTRAEIESSGRKETRDGASQIARTANETMARNEDQLKRALAAEAAAQLEAEKQRQRDEARARERREEERREAERRAAEQLALDRLRERAMTAFEDRPNTTIAGGTTLGLVHVNSLLECKMACLAVGCEAFAFQKGSPPHACYRYRGRGVTDVPQSPTYTAGRLR